MTDDKCVVFKEMSDQYCVYNTSKDPFLGKLFGFRINYCISKTRVNDVLMKLRKKGYKYVLPGQGGIQTMMINLVDENAEVPCEDLVEDVVQLGSIVKVVMGGQTVRLFTIVKPNETHDGGFISDESPIGQALLGHKKYETVEAQMPNGPLELFIMEIDNSMIPDEKPEDTDKRLGDLESYVASIDAEFNDRLCILEKCFEEIIGFKPSGGLGWDVILPRVRQVLNGGDPGPLLSGKIGVLPTAKPSIKTTSRKNVYSSILPHSKNYGEKANTKEQQALYDHENLKVVTNLPNNVVKLNSIVTFIMDGEKKTFMIVKPDEVDVTNDCISYESPIGEAMVGHKAGEKVTAHLKDDDAEIEILSVDN